ncbi:trp operon leader peptide [Streptomyces benahoarensis]|uniref:Trp operon leader peptide n=1 Tax=Streptomyces benahoarensis TaxID=2595054 RepID=A0A553ZJ80_9ACTN|nr:trp operon leader peptide [Streptomyces benahoarensis]TSB41524.1 trp operon leader peptide [Streptomyces benahoarensis]
MLPPAWVSAFTVTPSTLRGPRRAIGRRPEYETDRTRYPGTPGRPGYRLRTGSRPAPDRPEGGRRHRVPAGSGRVPGMYAPHVTNWWWTAHPAAR